MRKGNVAMKNHVLTDKQLKKYKTEWTAASVDSFLALSVLALNETFKFGQKRLEKFLGAVTQKADDVYANRIKTNEMFESVKEKTGIDLVKLSRGQAK